PDVYGPDRQQDRRQLLRRGLGCGRAAAVAHGGEGRDRRGEAEEGQELRRRPGAPRRAARARAQAGRLALRRRQEHDRAAAARARADAAREEDRQKNLEVVMQIKDATFIVTGGASGLGEGTVRMLVESGARVVVADLQTDKGEALAKQLGAKARFVKCDVTSEADGQAAVERALRDF